MKILAQRHLAGRRALVTGAGSGIGLATALSLADAGADIVLGVKSPHKTGALADRITEMGRSCTIAQMDMLDLESTAHAYDQAVASFGKIDILVNNAGGGIGDLALDVSPEDFDHSIALNVKAPFFLSQRFAKSMVSAGQSGDIVNISSQAALVALPGEPVYCLAKAALSHMTRCLAVEWGAYGIRVNAVAPTFIETPGTEKALSDPIFKSDTEERVAALKRLGQPEEVASCVTFLVSSGASLVTGHTLVADGGWTIR
jgi:2-deoxy-D-gluconate 3-dehydrogenase